MAAPEDPPRHRRRRSRAARASGRASAESPRTLTSAELLQGRVLVVSPHFDDAALSLGATIALATRTGASVTVLTVFGDDPTSTAPAGPWDAACGFSSVGEAATARRAEDELACAALGAATAWLPFGDEQYARGGTDDEIWGAMEPHVRGHDLVLLPGFPLDHEDHAFLVTLVLQRRAEQMPASLYVEQPYATARVIGRGYSPGPLIAATRIALRTKGARGLQTPILPAAIAHLVTPPPEWHAIRTTAADRRAKSIAVRAYASQLIGLGRRLVERISLYERCWGGEGVSAPLSEV